MARSCSKPREAEPGQECWRCGGGDHLARDCRQGGTRGRGHHALHITRSRDSRPTIQSSSATAFCSNCDMAGHYIRQCPELLAELGD